MEIKIEVKDGDITIVSDTEKYSVNVLGQPNEPYDHYDMFVLTDEMNHILSEVFYNVNVLCLFKDGMIYNMEQQKLYAPKNSIDAGDANWVKEYMHIICRLIQEHSYSETVHIAVFDYCSCTIKMYAPKLRKGAQAEDVVRWLDENTDYKDNQCSYMFSKEPIEVEYGV